MEGGYQILNLGKVNLTSTSRLVPGAYDYITKNLQHKTVLLEGLRLDGKDYDAIFTTFAKSSDNYIGNFVIDSRIYSLIVRPSDMCNTKRLVPVGDDTIEMTEAMIAEAWDKNEVYVNGDYVTDAHSLYKLIADTSTNEKPSTHPDKWQRTEVTSGVSTPIETGTITPINVYRSDVFSYIKMGKLVQVIMRNVGINVSSDTQIGSIPYKPAVDNVYFRGMCQDRSASCVWVEATTGRIMCAYSTGLMYMSFMYICE